MFHVPGVRLSFEKEFQERQLSKQEYQDMRRSMASATEGGISENLPELDKKTRELSRQDSITINATKKGVACRTHSDDIHPHYNEASGETVVQGENNNYIVFGRDRPRGVMSGYGGRGEAQCGMIDIVVGRHGIFGDTTNEEGTEIYLDSSPELDTARIYISQKTDIDQNFGITQADNVNSRHRSAILLKADDVRMVARENIKIVTGVDRWNSVGFQPISTGGIHLIAGNKGDNLQPLVLGENLIRCLESIMDEIIDTQKLSLNLAQWAIKTTSFLMAHTHVSTTPGSPVTPSLEVATGVASGILVNDLVKVISDTMINLTNQTIDKVKYLKPTPPLIEFDNILSKHNKTN
jgi:hypothetical protein